MGFPLRIGKAGGTATSIITPGGNFFGDDASGNPEINAVTGKMVEFDVNNTNIAQADANGFNVTGNINILNGAGKFAILRGVGTAGLGVPHVFGHGAVTGQTANVASSSSFTPAATGSFEIEVRINVTGVAVGITPQVTYTDPISGAVTDAISLDREGVALPVLTATAVDRYTGRTLIRSTAALITVLTTGYVSGTYDLASWIKQVA